MQTAKGTSKASGAKGGGSRPAPRGQIDTPFYYVPDTDLERFNADALESIKNETGYSEADAENLQKAMQEYFGGIIQLLQGAKNHTK